MRNYYLTHKKTTIVQFYRFLKDFREIKFISWISP